MSALLPLALWMFVSSALGLPGERPGDVISVQLSLHGEPTVAYQAGDCSLGGTWVDSASTPPIRARWDVGSIWVPTLSPKTESAAIEVVVFAGEQSVAEGLRFVHPLDVQPIDSSMADAVWLRRFADELCEPWVFSRESWGAVFDRGRPQGRSVLLRYWAEGLGIRVLRGGSQPTLADPIPLLGLMQACERRRSACSAFLEYAYGHLDG